MPYSPPASTSDPTTGDAISSAWGDAVNTALDFLATNFPHCIVSNSTTQTATTNTLTKLDADTETSDIGGMHSTVTNNTRVTIPANEGGLYMMTATAQYAANATGERLLRFLVNNTTAYEAQSTAANPTGGLATRLNGTRFVNLAAGDYIEVQVRQNSGGDLAVQLLDFAVRWIATA